MSLKVLCLHGCCQSGEAIAHYMKNLIKICESLANIDFVFLDAQYDHSVKGRHWFPEQLEIEKIGKIAISDVTWGPTLDYVEEAITTQQPDVVIGFSQGANVLDTYLSKKDSYGIKRAVLFSGYSLMDDERKPRDLPVLVVHGTNDEVVPFELYPRYPHTRLIEHTKGHALPSSKPVLREIAKFIVGV